MAESHGGLNPDRASFTIALETAREQVIRATDTALDPEDPLALGTIETAVLAALLPARRARWSSRKVKNRRFRWSQRDHGARPDLPTPITNIDVAIHTPPLAPDPEDATRRTTPAGRRTNRPPRPPRRTRRVIITELMQTEPDRAWSGKEIAAHLAAPPRNILTQLAEWTRLGWLDRDTTGHYTLPTHRAQSLSTAGSA